MKLVLNLVGVFGLLVSLNAHAQMNPSNDPFVLCNTFTFDSDKAKCVKEINEGRYYDAGAIGVCKTYTFDSDKLKCIKAIRDKSYFSGEMNVCRNMTFDSDKTKCLNNSGQSYQGGPTPNPGCPSVGQIKRDISRILNQLENGRYNRALRGLTNLYYDVENCD